MTAHLAPEPPEYLPLPAGFAGRVAELTDAGTDPSTAAWMAASEALGAVGRRETNDAALFWHGDPLNEQRDAWDRIADREGARFYWYQRQDTLVGYLACALQKARTSRDMVSNLYEKERERRAALRAEVLREAAAFIDNDDTCECGGCDTCQPRKLAAGLRRMADAATPTSKEQQR